MYNDREESKHNRPRAWSSAWIDCICGYFKSEQ